MREISYNVEGTIFTSYKEAKKFQETIEKSQNRSTEIKAILEEIPYLTGEEKNKMSRWEKNAIDVETLYGVFVDWEERFYNCPWCGEPVYEVDWSEKDLTLCYCPICENTDAEEE